MKKGPSLAKWTKPGFLGKIIGDPKPEQFGITRKADSNIPISLKIGDLSIQWDGVSWVNGRISDPSKNAYPPPQDIKEMKIKNAQLQIECEILLNMLTKAEIKKAKLKRELEDKKIVLQELIERVEAEQESEG